jgi:hypothetical protein
MPTSTWRKRASEGVAAAGVLLAAANAGADYRDAYRRGVVAAGQENWPETARLMRSALAERAREGEPIALEGDRKEPYLPRYYLGLALFHSGDCLGARRHWESSRRHGALRRSSFYRTVQKLNQECQKRLPREAAAAQSARALEGELRKADALAGALAVLESNPEVVGEDREAVVRGLREGREHLAEARSRLDGGRRSADLGELDEARERTQRATDTLEKARRKAMRHLAPLAAGRSALAPSASPSTEDAAPPAELVTAARAYFDGRYQEAADALAATDYGSGPAALQAHVLRAAARHALYLLGGRRDDALRRAVDDDVQAVRRLDPTFEPSASAFSPRFRELFRSKG